MIGAFCSNPADSRCDPSNNKLLSFNRSDTYTFSGSITGPGQVFQIGSGKTVLTGNSTYSGPTFVEMSNPDDGGILPPHAGQKRRCMTLPLSATQR